MELGNNQKTVRVFCPRGCYHADISTLLEPAYVNESCLCGSLMTPEYETSYLKNKADRKEILNGATLGLSEFCSELAQKILDKSQ